MVFPHIVEMANQKPAVSFLKIDVDEAPDVAQLNGVRFVVERCKRCRAFPCLYLDSGMVTDPAAVWGSHVGSCLTYSFMVPAGSQLGAYVPVDEKGSSS